MSYFKKYKRTNIAEMRPVTDGHISDFKKNGKLLFANDGDYRNPNKVSISDADLANGSPKIGDMIARNPENHDDQWLVAKDYFEANFAEA